MLDCLHLPPLQYRRPLNGGGLSISIFRPVKWLEEGKISLFFLFFIVCFIVVQNLQVMYVIVIAGIRDTRRTSCSVVQRGGTWWNVADPL